MIQIQTILKPADNSGIKNARCIKVMKGFNGNNAKIGDIVLTSIQGIRLVRKIKKGELFFGIIVRTSKENIYKDGSYTKFKTNSIVLLNKSQRILSSNIFGPISKNLRKKKLMRLIIIAAYNII
jgi:large subunit ribosomal protein L14